MRFCLLAAILCCPLLPAAEPSSGWISLFDGKSLDGWWWSPPGQNREPSWVAENGILRATPDRGERVYLMTKESFSDFEFEFEWKMDEPGANSGVKYRFQGYWHDGTLKSSPEGPGRPEPVALEYQIIDDTGHADALSDRKHTTAAIYEYREAQTAESAKPGVWYRSRIVACALHIEHWLNGKKVVDAQLGSADMQQAFAASKRRGSSPVLAKHTRKDSPIALQFHDGSVRFRNLRIRRLSGCP